MRRTQKEQVKNNNFELPWSDYYHPGQKNWNMTLKKIIQKKCSKSNQDNSLRYFHQLNQVRQVADLPGKRFIKAEALRIKEKYLFLESHLI